MYQPKHTSEFILEAFLDGMKNTQTLPKFVHSDQGSEFCSEIYTSSVEKLGVQISMSTKASPWENGTKNLFTTTLKQIWDWSLTDLKLWLTLLLQFIKQLIITTTKEYTLA